MGKKVRKIGILIGSESDLAQCVLGLAYLIDQVKKGKVIVDFVHPASQHRRTLTVQSILYEYSRSKQIDVLITGAGWANHLSGCCDAFLRFSLQDSHIVTFAVAFEDADNETHTLAACVSSSEVPGHQMINTDGKGDPLKGSKGFLWVCETAVEGNLPEVKAKTPPPYKSLTLLEAYEIGLEKQQKKYLRLMESVLKNSKKK